MLVAVPGAPCAPAGIRVCSAAPFTWTRVKVQRGRTRRRSQSRRERLASLGAAGALSYTSLKLLKHAVINGIAWYLTAKRLGLPPPRRWPTFMATYAAVYVASTPLQPVKWAMIAAMSPAVDRMMGSMSGRLQWSKKQTAGLLFLIVAAIAAVVWLSGILLASALAKTPIW
ncbi:unnamed protein product [Effrenium voratum]|nr:unnamed protein product [Effrenium voratum]